MALARRSAYVLAVVTALVAGSLAAIVLLTPQKIVPTTPGTTKPPCPFIVASSPATRSTTLPPQYSPQLSPCPGVVMGTYLGGRGAESARDVAVDASGYAYVVGTTNSSDFPTTDDAYDRTYAGSEFWVGGGDVFVAKFDPWGALVYSTLLGGSGAEFGNSIAVDQSGNVYVAGTTASGDFPTTPNAYDRTLDYGAPEAFVAKFDPTGSLIYSTLLGTGPGGGLFTDSARSIAVDASGYGYLTGDGSFASSEERPGALSGAFVAKLNPEGSDLVFSTVIGGGLTFSRDSAVDAQGSVWVAGWTLSGDFPTTPGALDTDPGNNTLNAFVFKLSPDGRDLIYSTYLGGEDGSTNQAFAIAIDSEGNAHVAGGTSAVDFPTTPGAYDRTFNGGEPGIEDVFVLGMSPTGQLLYSTFLGGARSEVALGIYLDESDSVHVAGYTASNEFPTTHGAFDSTFNGFSDVFVAKLERNGTGLNYSTFLGGGDEVLLDPAAVWGCQGSCEDLGFGLAVDPTGNATVVGGTMSPDFPTTENAIDPTFNGEVDAFSVRMELLPEPNRAPVAYFEVTASPDDNGFLYASAANSADAEDETDLLEIRWDWEGDGVWDTDWSPVKTVSHDYVVPGSYRIRLEVRDAGGLMDETARQVSMGGAGPPNETGDSDTATRDWIPLWVSFAVPIVSALAALGVLLFIRHRSRLGHSRE